MRGIIYRFVPRFLIVNAAHASSRAKILDIYIYIYTALHTAQHEIGSLHNTAATIFRVARYRNRTIRADAHIPIFRKSLCSLIFLDIISIQCRNNIHAYTLFICFPTRKVNSKKKERNTHRKSTPLGVPSKSGYRQEKKTKKEIGNDTDRASRHSKKGREAPTITRRHTNKHLGIKNHPKKKLAMREREREKESESEDRRGITISCAAAAASQHVDRAIPIKSPNSTH